MRHTLRLRVTKAAITRAGVSHALSAIACVASARAKGSCSKFCGTCCAMSRHIVSSLGMAAVDVEKLSAYRIC